jgi:hypothetical protein
VAWTTPTWIDLRDTAAYVTDPTGAGPLPADPASNLSLPDYSLAGHTNSPLTINGNTFNAGWNVGATQVDGARDRSSSVSDKRLAGMHLSGTHVLSIQAGNAAGVYNIWLGVTDQSGYGFPAGTITIADAHGTLTTVTLPSGHSSGTAVCDATGTAYATAALWASANPVAGGGSYISLTTTDTSNGNGGPLLTFTTSVSLPMSTVGIQFAGGGGGGAQPSYYLGSSNFF